MGFFCYDFSVGEQNLVQRVAEILRSSQGIVNHFALGENYFVRRWNRESAIDLQMEETENDFYNVYHLRSLAFSYFISNLIARSSMGASERYWFLFPIERTKEINRVETVEIQNQNEA